MRQFMLSATILIGFMLSSCEQDVQSFAQDAPTPDIIASEVKPIIPASQYKTPEDLSPSERAEQKALWAKRNEGSKAHSKAYRAWAKQDPESRGPKPKWKRTTLSEDENQRLWTLNDKRQAYVYQSKYQHHVPKYLSQNEVNELVASYMKLITVERKVEQKIGRKIKRQSPSSEGFLPSEVEEYNALRMKQNEGAKAHKEAMRAWGTLDPIFRGSHPQWTPTLSKVERQRVGVFKDKLQIAVYQRTYEQYVPEHLSQDELNELMSSIGMIYKIERKIEQQKFERRIKSIELGRKFLESRELEED